MKKMIFAFLLIILVVLSFTACSKNYSENIITVNDFDSEEDTQEEITRGYVDVQSEIDAIKNADSLVWGSTEDSIVTFGAYEQDGNIFNGPESIEWYVINNDNGAAILYSVYCLDCQPYHDDSSNLKNINWSTCSLRSWLNDEFYNDAFSDEEKEFVALNSVTEEKSTEFDETTTDYVQLPNAGNVSGFFWGEKENMIAEFTEYAEKKYSSAYHGRYWTRELAEDSGPGYGTVIDADGKVIGSSYYWMGSQAGTGVPLSEIYGVRPIIMIRFPENTYD